MSRIRPSPQTAQRCAIPLTQSQRCCRGTAAHFGSRPHSLQGHSHFQNEMCIRRRNHDMASANQLGSALQGQSMQHCTRCCRHGLSHDHRLWWIKSLKVFTAPPSSSSLARRSPRSFCMRWYRSALESELPGDGVAVRLLACIGFCTLMSALNACWIQRLGQPSIMSREGCRADDCSKRC